jgi:hypothetical protein
MSPQSLRLYNIGAGLLHLTQGIVILMLSSGFSLPVTATFLEGPPGSAPPLPTELFSIDVGYALALFVFLSAAAHFIVSAPRIWDWYMRNLGENRNYARWIEYSISSSLMVVIIAMLPGISDIAALLSIFFLNAGMIFFGLLMEHYEQPGNPNWLSYSFGTLLGIVPWAAIAIYLWSPVTDSSPPAFVYAIFFSIFLFFNSFAINMVLQYRRIGPWRNYMVGESTYILLSLTAKSALAWQLFAGTLAG